ncbi:MAG TPA: hypothetical protein VF614_16170, partial [Chthoniobacteraceae bacterium]
MPSSRPRTSAVLSCHTAALLKRGALTAIGTISILAPIAEAQLNIDNTAGTYSINFDTSVSGVNNGTFNGSGFSPAPAAGQLDSDAWSATGSLDNGDLAFGGEASGSTNDYSRGMPATPPTSGGIYAFSGGSISGVGLGIQPTAADFSPGTVTLRLQNTTGSFLNGLTISYNVHVRNDGARG